MAHTGDLQCFQTFEFAVCFAHFDFFEISTPVMLIMLSGMSKMMI